MQSAKVQTRMRKFSSRVRRLKSSSHKYGAVMAEYKKGALYSSSGYLVTKPNQARAIAYSMSRGGKSKYTKVRRTGKSKPQSVGVIARIKSFFGFNR